MLLRNNYNFQLIDYANLREYYDIPQIYKCNVKLPAQFIAFNFAQSCNSNQSDFGIHFYLDDYQFERVWTRPTRYIKLLRKYACVLSPDFSLYTDMPLAMQIWNTYRSRLLGQYWQDNGINVIPTVSWSDERSYSFCFDGLPRRSVISVSTRGCVRQAEPRKLWQAGMAEAVRRLEPTKILIYGSKIEFDHGDAEVIWIPARKITKVVNSGKRTEYLVSHLDLIREIAVSKGINVQDLDDFCQDVIVKSMNDADKFDPAKCSIATWSGNFVKICVKKFRQKYTPKEERLTPELEAKLLDFSEYQQDFD